MPSFMLLLHQSPAMFQQMSPDEIQKIIAKYRAWRDDLVRRNKILGGEKLSNDGGRRIRLEGDRVSVTDGPYAEASEVIGGYFTIEAANYSEAVEVARSCPHLTGRQWIEVRQVDAGK